MSLVRLNPGATRMTRQMVQLLLDHGADLGPLDALPRLRWTINRVYSTDFAAARWWIAANGHMVAQGYEAAGTTWKVHRGTETRWEKGKGYVPSGRWINITHGSYNPLDVDVERAGIAPTNQEPLGVGQWTTVIRTALTEYDPQEAE